jgi:hypothetical protein
MKESIKLVWQCEECKDVIVSYSYLSHNIDYCECKKSAVDLEANYQREIGKVKEISRKRIIN